MGIFQPLIEELDQTMSWSRVFENFSDAGRADAQRLWAQIRELLVEGEELGDENLPTSAFDAIQNADFHVVFDRAIESSIGSRRNSRRDWVDVRQDLVRLRDTLIQNVRPYVRIDSSRRTASADAQIEELVDLAQQYEARLQELASQQAALASKNVEAAAGDLSPEYKAQATTHREAAKRWLVASLFTAGVFAAGTVWSFFLDPPAYTADASAEQWLRFVRGASGRVVLLSLAAVALAFCLRNYRVNQHLTVLNSRSVNALETFRLLSGAVTTDDARNLVVGELVRAVFSGEDTGFLAGQGDRTVIEAPGGAAMLAALTRGGGQPG
ncbi:hypothetical protein QE370_003474 [Aeromicrobium sp. SORGH_AS981]|uniref:hypothetical protein n=1 Tax=Aeromicrobium sp. SORGH_AS_0981 TaxID=3041802 RepID=UPI00285CB55A|nr:hypothetical protein [Aeromicrobium sp. SORGH_AS_0981]MDR6120290.1 hypothetical protein [Aeromicrobium sp. SORGH_AS_0981]